MNIPAMDIPAGETLYPLTGPVNTGVGFNGFTLVIDIGQLVDPCTFIMRYYEDGVTYRDLGQETYQAGAAVNRNGTPANPPNINWSPNLGEFGGVKNLTNAQSKVAIVLRNTTPWHSAGGTLTPF